MHESVQKAPFVMGKIHIIVGKVIKMAVTKESQFAKQLLTIQEVCDYLGIGQNSTLREGMALMGDVV